MPYGQVHDQRPFERASKIAHSQIVNSPLVREFLSNCSLPEAPPAATLVDALTKLPPTSGGIKTVIAIDGGMTETYVRDRFPTASILFMNLGPLLLNLSDLDDLDRQPFLGPEDMARLKNLERYTLVLPARLVRVGGCKTFSQGVRKAVQDFLLQGDAHLMSALRWLLFQGWLPEDERVAWKIPRCPNASCGREDVAFRWDSDVIRTCPDCGDDIYLSDAFRLYERIDEELGAGAIASYLLTTLEQLVLIHVIRSVMSMKTSLLPEILFVKDGPLAFFGVTAPLHRPMRDLMKYLGDSGPQRSLPLINLVGLEKSGPFVEHAILIEQDLTPGHLLILNNDYIYSYIEPGDSERQTFGQNTYYGAKVIFRSEMGDTYVATIPTGAWKSNPTLEDLYNVADVLGAVARLRCSMYDNALLPIALANHLVSLADMPSSQILAKFSRDRIER